MPVIFFIITISLWISAGLFLIIGTIKGVKVLNDPPLNWFLFYPYKLLKHLGRKAIYYYHIMIGVVFIIAALLLLYIYW